MQRLTLKRNGALLAMLAACAAVFLTALDQTVVVTALPQVITDLKISPTHLDRAAWIVSGYLLGYVIVMPLMGRVSDLYGRRRIFLLSLTIFALGSLFCGLAPWLGDLQDLAFLQNVGVDVSSPGLVWLVAARFIQAVGGGAVIPIAMAVAGDLYGYQKRALILGLIGMVTEAGGVLGPLYGTLIMQIWGWPAIFYLNLPIVALLAVLIIFFIPGSFSRTELRPRGAIDLWGALLFGASLLCMSLGLAQEAAQITPQSATATTQETAQNNPWLIAASVVLLLGFVLVEIWLTRRGRTPLIDLTLFKRPMFSAASLVSLLIGAALIIAMVDIPIFFITVLNRPLIESGVALLRLTAMIPVGAVLGGWLCARITCRWTAVLGLVPAIAGFYLMSLWPVDVGQVQITVSTLSGGLGLGLVIAPISTTAMNAAQPQQLGLASSLVTVLRMVGMILGLAALTSWGLGRFRNEAAAFHPSKGVTLGSQSYFTEYAHYLIGAAHDIYTAIFLAAGILCAIAVVPALFLQGSSKVDQPDKAQADSIASSEKAELA
ncbi:MFS transporter [Tengunoibacter tsumagoiensis]|uniref:MFS-type drug efflux transporter P55 n=1 Tax=Tengunoibacter tsumagoiensis TaxID=2014871 RepID=A0A401ZUF1_9CHLR|nr:MFS transporter [Tengunoibacter tsumagoiensis]GCE10416.1 MFS transporter [Tengunoibacter tsumagoiensis]